MNLREARNVYDLKQRDRLVRRIAQIRRDAVIDRNTIVYWNERHPSEPPMSTAFEDALILWCDGKGPLPDVPLD